MQPGSISSIIPATFAKLRRRKIVTRDVPVAFRSSFGNVVVARALESNGKNCGGRNSEEEDREKGSPSEGIVSSANRQ